ncbi:uncharacterized protein PAN0_002d1452 [Moesziomyces antarcticus]|uniref:Uncharacterized protein n=1 Tax=Pseudozyma antarctica TaxID=84753 RepID=A0A5C3FFS3_PSEA2|nr:uncharacterized protein PAN0_002d1452 [Moesziomyces antarcticus]GAK63248.1 conserved hypothetical protein [Moesziomyces antarcticus]SPO43262.1 uncharacterized protein PSANT_00946 [Moesziomyces antarcticus]
MTRPDGADSAVPSAASHGIKTISTSASVTLPKPCILLTAEQRGALSLRILRHTRSSPLPDADILAFQALVNDSFRGPYHDENFGGKLRYPTARELVDDLNHSDEGGWVFMLSTAEGVPVAGAKVTFSGVGMDAGPGIHTLPNPTYIPDDAQGKPVFWLGALGSVAPGTGSAIIAHIKKFLAESYPHGYVLKAFTVAEWGVNPDFAIPQDSPLVTFFERQAFKVSEYSWKAPGTWDSFYGGCLAAIEYVHTP